jgi:hypothetical protein
MDADARITGSYCSAIRIAASRSGRALPVPIDSMRDTPASTARLTTASRSSVNRRSSRCVCESTSVT